MDPVKRVLLHDCKPVQLPSRAFDVLMALVEHNKYVIDKDELMRLVWGERIVEENNLTRHISTLRKVLDESPNDHRYIVTVPGRGYSFVAEVETVLTKGVESPASKKNDDSSVVQLGSTVTRDNAAEPVTPIDSVYTTEAGGLNEQHPLGRKTVTGSAWYWTLAIVGLALCVLLGFTLLKTRLRQTGVKSYREWDTVRLTRNGSSHLPAISGDGKYVAYVNKEAGHESVWILQLATSTSQQIVPPQKYRYFDVLFSSDGNELYFARCESLAPRRSLYRIPVIGGVGKKLRDDIYSSIALSQTNQLAFGRRNSEGKYQYVIADADGVELRVLTERRVDLAAWSPDGKVIAYSQGNAGTGGDTMSLNEVRVNDGSHKEIAERRWNHVGNKSWLPDATGLLVSAREQKSNINQLWFVAYPSGQARLLSNNLDNFHRTSLTRDGNIMVAEQIAAVSDVWSCPVAQPTGAKKIGAWGMSGLGLLADERVVYSSVQSGETGKICVMNSDGTERKQLTSGDGHDTSCVASPDGRYIVFASNRSGNFEIWRMNVDGGNLIQLTASAGSNMPSTSPDSRWVIYQSPADGRLYRISIEGGETVPVGSKAVGASAVSPDGKHIAYICQVKDSWEIAINSFEGSPIMQLVVGARSLNNTSVKWSPDGKAVLYVDNADGVGNVWMRRLDGETAKQLTDFKADGLFRFDISSDGKNLVCARGGWKHDAFLIRNLR